MESLITFHLEYPYEYIPNIKTIKALSKNINKMPNLHNFILKCEKTNIYEMDEKFYKELITKIFSLKSIKIIIIKFCKNFYDCVYTKEALIKEFKDIPESKIYNMKEIEISYYLRKDDNKCYII